MRLRRPRASGDGAHDPARPEGTALVQAVADAAVGGMTELRSVAFAVAQAIRDGDELAPRALTALLEEAPPVAAADPPTLMNVLTALQLATMLPEDARADWVPPRHAVARFIMIGLLSDEAVRQQSEGLLGVLVDRGLAAEWLGRDALGVVAANTTTSDLRAELKREAHRQERLEAPISSGAEIPAWAFA